MGNRSYLSLASPRKETTLFEANNSLPFFWILFLDEDSLDQKGAIWKRIEEFSKTHSEEEVEEFFRKNSTDFEISYEKFITKSTDGRKFIKKNFPNALPLYDDFIKFIKDRFGVGDKLVIDWWQFTNFYSSFDDFSDSIKSELNAVKTDNPNGINFLMTDDLVAGGTGFEAMGNEFSKFPSYQDALKDREIRPSKRVKTETKFSTKMLVQSLVKLAICPFFSVIAFKMIREQGFNFGNVLLLLTNIGFYIFSIWGILAEIKAHRKK